MDRPTLIETLNKLSSVQLNKIIWSVGMPAAEQPGPGAQNGERVIALLMWAESLTGCGLDQIENALNPTPVPVPKEVPAPIAQTFSSPFSMTYQKNFDELLSILMPLGDNEDNLRFLGDQIKSDGIIPFVGAGLSIPFGMPSWDNFLLGLAEKRGIKSEIQARLKAKEYEEAAEDLLEEYGPRAFHDKIEVAFGNNNLESKKFATEAVSVLPQLAVGPVITTNFDHVLEIAFKQSSYPFDRVVIGTKTDLIARALHSRKRFLLKIHGDVEDRTDRILTFSDYQYHYGTTSTSQVDLSKPLPAHLKAMIVNRPLLFLGCSLDQDRMTLILAHIAQTLGGLCQYAIVAQPNDFQEFRKRAQQLSQFSIRPIWYPKEKHELIKPLLEYLVSLSKLYSSVVPSLPPSQPLVSQSGFKQVKRDALEKRLALLNEQYIVANKQFDETLEEVLRVRIRVRIESLEVEIQEIEAELEKLK